MGLERLAAILQKVKSNYDTDLFKYLIEYSSNSLGIQYGEKNDIDISFRVLADHARAATFLISDGVTPSSEGRGYVLRRIIRRAIRHYKMLGINDPYLYKLSQEVINNMKDFYIELDKNKDTILSLIKNEEMKFLTTIDKGLDQLNVYIKQSEESRILKGENIFKLYDTFGFPVDLIEDVLKNWYSTWYKRLWRRNVKPKKVFKQASKFKSTLNENINLENVVKKLEDGFVFYDNLFTESKIIAIIKDNELVDSATSGQRVSIIFNKTPFYAESGGQVGDKGEGVSSTTNIEVFDTQKSKENLIIHESIIKKGSFLVGQDINLQIDEYNSALISCHHSATHILVMFKETLGTHKTSRITRWGFKIKIWF